MIRSSRSRAFTLLELVVVLAIIAVLASVLLPSTERLRDDAYEAAAKATLQTVREALLGSPAGAGYIDDMRTVPGFNFEAVRIHDLLENRATPPFDRFDPVLRRGWRGPYLMNVRLLTVSAEGDPKEFGVADPWGHPIILQLPSTSDPNPGSTPSQHFPNARLVSAGANGVLEVMLDTEPDQKFDPPIDDLVLYLFRNAPPP